MASIVHTFPNAFSSKEIFEFRLKFHSSLFIRVQLIIYNTELVQVMAWCQTGTKPLSESMVIPRGDPVQCRITRSHSADDFTLLGKHIDIM